MYEYLDNINVVVIGSIHHNTLGVIRSLGEEGILKDHIYVLLVNSQSKTKSNIITKSRYIEKDHVITIADCNKIMTCLKDISGDGVKRVVICCSDGTAETVIGNADELGSFYRSPTTKMNVVDLMDKNNQGRIATECGLNVPKNIVFEKGSELVWDIYPCITKPLKSASGAGKHDIFIINNSSDLNTTINKIESRNIQIQEFINKKMEFQLIGCSLNAGEQIIIPGYTEIIRQPQNTNTGYLKYSPINELDFDLDLAHKFIKKIGYSGLFSMEFIRGEDGKDYFLEINMRNDGNAYCVKSAGVNLPFIWSYYQIFDKLPETSISIKNSVFFIPDFNDLKIALKNEGFMRWVKDFFKADSHSIYNKQDIWPFIFEIFKQIKKVLHIK